MQGMVTLGVGLPYLPELFFAHVNAQTKTTTKPGGTPYDGLYGEAPPERGTFFRLQVYKRLGISQV